MSRAVLLARVHAEPDVRVVVYMPKRLHTALKRKVGKTQVSRWARLAAALKVGWLDR